MDYATKGREWGDSVASFAQQREVGCIQLDDSLRVSRWLGGGGVSISYATTINLGGGVQQTSEGALMLQQADAADLARVLLGEQPPVDPGAISRAVAENLTESAARLMGAPMLFAAKRADGSGYGSWLYTSREKAERGACIDGLATPKYEIVGLVEVGAKHDVEAAAKRIYSKFPGADAHPWAEGGNSDMQDEARQYARAALGVL